MRKKTFTFFLIGISFLVLTFFIPNTTEAQTPCPQPECACVSGVRGCPESLPLYADRSTCLLAGDDCCCPTVTVDLKADWEDGPINIPFGSSATLSWTSKDADWCWACCGTNWVGSKLTQDSQPTPNLFTSTTSDLACYPYGEYNNPNAVRDMDSVTINVTYTCLTIPGCYCGIAAESCMVGYFEKPLETCRSGGRCCCPSPNPPTANLEVFDGGVWGEGPITVPAGSTVPLRWDSTGPADDCIASGSGDWTGSKGRSGTGNVVVNSNTTYSLRCFNLVGSETDSVTVNVSGVPLPGDTCTPAPCKGVCVLPGEVRLACTRGYSSSGETCPVAGEVCCCLTGVILYENNNYAPSSIDFPSNDNDLGNDSGPCVGSSWNDCVNSIKIASGYEVALFEDINYGGACNLISSDTANLDSWNDRVSSFAIGNPPSPSCVVGPGPVGPGIGIENPLSAKSLEELVENLIDFIFKIALVLTPLMIIIAGFLLVTAGGSIEQVTKARRIILWAVIGFLIVLLAKGIVAIIKGLLGG